MIKIAAVVGPTAVGKTALAIALARRMNGEVISFDSMQIYRGMDIGTAKPTPAERRAVPHHLLDIRSPDEPFSCADYVPLAETAAADIAARDKLPIFCGGTGLYLDSVLGLSAFSAAGSDDAYRDALASYAAAHGAEALHARLAAVDPAAADAIHPNNVRRVIRALEIHHLTGQTKTETDARARAVEPKYDARIIGLRFRDRSALYRRIEARVDQMMEDGLLDEVRALFPVLKPDCSAAQAIGYKELFAYLRGECSLDAAVDTLKTATRRYAKRQMTWFSRNPDVYWLDVDCEDGTLREADALVNDAAAYIAGK